MTDNPIEVARGIAERAHDGQVDKSGAPYIEHPAMVVDLLQRLPGYQEADPLTQQDAVVAAWLHDVVEDSPIMAEDLLAAGVSQRATDTVVALTRQKTIPPEDYYRALAERPVALLVKTADLAANLHPARVALLDDATLVRLAAKYANALQCLGIARSTIDEVYR